MRLIITDVTEMHGGNYCVAGWDAVSQRMVRPLPNGNNWTAGLLQQHGISPGSKVDVAPTRQRYASTYPHKTEDTPVDPATMQRVPARAVNWLAASAPPSHATVSAAFGGHLIHTGVWDGARKGVHIAEATRICSLSAVAVSVDQVELFEDNYQGKRRLRAYLSDGDACYNLPIVASHLREAYRSGGVSGAEQALPARGLVHVRLGLARAWPGQPGKCSLMINGIYG